MTDTQALPIYKKAIEGYIPVSFYYYSEKSKYFIGPEAPSHLRIVQPVCVGYKRQRDGSRKLYMRGYLLQKYSFSKNKMYDIGSTVKKYTAKVKNWRLYKVEKQKNLTLLQDYPIEYRAYVHKYVSYNPEDTFFDQIVYAIPANGTNQITYINKNQPLNFSPSTSNYYQNTYPRAPTFEEETSRIHKIMESINPYLSIPIILFEDYRYEYIGTFKNGSLYLNTNYIKNIKEKYVHKDLQKILSILGGKSV